jgi:hypothetical protein
MKVRTTIRLPQELLMRAKLIAAAERRTLASLVEDALGRVVDDRAGAAGPARVAPRVSKAKGWFAPGITSIRDIEELEDREYVERLRQLE